MPKITRSLFMAGLLSALVSGLFFSHDARAQAELPPVAFEIRPLPGKLNGALLLNSNNPEILESPGIIVDTLSLKQPLNGRFGVFAHHLVHRPPLAASELRLGLMAYNPNDSIVSLDMVFGHSFLTWPQAPFKKGPALSAQWQYAGPGDALASHWIRGGVGVPYRQWSLLPGQSRLLLEMPLPTLPDWDQQDISGLFLNPGKRLLSFARTRVNARSSLLHFSSSGPVHLALIAAPHSVYAKDPQYIRSQFWPQEEAHYYKLWQAGTLAGPAEPEATSYDPKTRLSGGVFRYGRVAGISQGLRWVGKMEQDVNTNTALGFPLSSLYLKDLNSGQNQSAPLLARKAGTAQEAHANYGVHYLIPLHLYNHGTQSLSCNLGLAHPNGLQAVSEQPPGISSDSPQRYTLELKAGDAVRFRGSFQLRTQNGLKQWRHVVLHQGQYLPQVFRIQLKAQSKYKGLLEWVYPPDATPPQLLTLHCQPDVKSR